MFAVAFSPCCPRVWRQFLSPSLSHLPWLMGRFKERYRLFPSLLTAACTRQWERAAVLSFLKNWNRQIRVYYATIRQKSSRNQLQACEG